MISIFICRPTTTVRYLYLHTGLLYNVDDCRMWRQCTSDIISTVKQQQQCQQRVRRPSAFRERHISAFVEDLLSIIWASLTLTKIKYTLHKDVGSSLFRRRLHHYSVISFTAVNAISKFAVDVLGDRLWNGSPYMLSDRCLSCLSVLSCPWRWCIVGKRLDGSKWNLAPR